MPVAASTVWPRNCSILGSDKWSSIVAALSLSGTFGILCFETEKGNEAYLYINGSNPMTLMFGGVAQLSAPAGGTAIGTPIVPVAAPATPGGVSRLAPGWTVFGTSRVIAGIGKPTSTIMVCAAPGGAPAVGLMNNSTNAIQYIYVTDDGTTMKLNVGTEAQWLAKTVMVTPIAAIAKSGAVGRYAEGRTVLVDTPGGDGIGSPLPQPVTARAATPTPVALVVQSAGQSGAIGLMSSDFSSGIAISYDPVAAGLRYDAIPNWYTWSGINSYP